MKIVDILTLLLDRQIEEFELLNTTSQVVQQVTQERCEQIRATRIELGKLINLGIVEI